MSKQITDMTAEQIWAASGDMDIKEAIQSYGSPWNAAKEAVDFVDEEYPIDNDEDLSIRTSVIRKVEEYLVRFA